MRGPLVAALIAGMAPALAGSDAAFADQFLGEEPASAGETNSADESSAPEAEAPADTKATKHARRGSSDEDSHPFGDFRLSGGVGAAPGYVDGQLTGGYDFNRWSGLELTYYYDRFANSASAGQQYGPEFDFILRLPNPTMLTPFVGAGPGYLKWIREDHGAAFDDHSSLTGNAFIGVNARLAKHFGLQLERKQTVYVNAVPKQFGNPDLNEARTLVTTQAAFRVLF